MESIKDILNNNAGLKRLKQLAAEQMKEHDYHEVTKQCNTCNDLGWVSVDLPYGNPQFGKPMLCPNEQCPKRIQIIETRRNALMKSAEIPAQYKNMTLESFERSVNEADAWEGKRLAHAAARLYIEDRNVSLGAAYELAGRKWEWEDIIRNGLVFQGDYGVGKTGLATAICNALIAAGVHVLYIRTLDFMGEVYRRYNKQEPPTADDIIDMAKVAGVLFLDDFNISNDTDNRKDIMETIIRYRHNNGLPTLVTCNMNRQQLAAAWGQRTIDALLASAHMIPMGGAPLRNVEQLNEDSAF